MRKEKNVGAYFMSIEAQTMKYKQHPRIQKGTATILMSAFSAALWDGHCRTLLRGAGNLNVCISVW